MTYFSFFRSNNNNITLTFSLQLVQKIFQGYCSLDQTESRPYVI